MRFSVIYLQRTTRNESRHGDRISKGSFTSSMYVPSFLPERCHNYIPRLNLQ